MSAITIAEIQPESACADGHELTAFDRTAEDLPGASGRPDSEAEASTQSRASIPKFKILTAGFSFLCAGIDGATLGPLLPYVIQSFTIGTGEVAIMFVFLTLSYRFRTLDLTKNSSYACIFAGWLLAAATNPFLAANLSFSALLALGATIQLLAQCLRPWAPQPLFFLSFTVQALGMAYQDSHANAWAGTLPRAHRCLGFIHAMFALGCFIGPLMATAVATATESGQQGTDGIEPWRWAYYLLIAVHGLNLFGMLVAFGNPLLGWKSRASVPYGRSSTAENSRDLHERRQNKEALGEIGQLVRLKNLWLIGGFYLFNCGAWSAAGGKLAHPCTLFHA